MTLNPYALLNLVTYFVALFAPSLLTVMFKLDAGQASTLTIIFYVIGAALMIYFVPKLNEDLVVEKKSTQTKSSKAIYEGIIGIAIVTAVQIGANLIEAALTGGLQGSENTQGILDVIQQNFAFILLVSIAGPIMEEIFFRRTLIGFLGNHFNFWIGAVASSLLFYLAHQDGHFLLYFTMGMTLALIYRNTGKILTSIIAHAGMNTLVILINLIPIWMARYF
ncbi:CPBP family intramembrane glutamic endopeptidase [Enterococcus timonensis]|uniref:CPBP family intramembrane glutamic endopeptidase n=1 Tax=Enterococcus timonensis TaxID=1852364 RepID=UPI0008DA761A|nr:type II CAAX endopeptidase family protein [Enterococcus timonensis]